jgi:site-specific recombinase XerD
MTDSLQRTGDQIRQSTSEEYEASFKDFIKVVGNKDIQQITLSDGGFYRQNCIDKGNSPATVHKKLTEIKAMFELGVKRKLLILQGEFCEIIDVVRRKPCFLTV